MDRNGGRGGPGYDDTVAEVRKDVEETTRDFVLETLAQRTKGHPFARFVAHLLRVMGYRTRVSPEGPDGGIDIVAHKDELGFEPPSSRCKSSHHDVRTWRRRAVPTLDDGAQRDRRGSCSPEAAGAIDAEIH